MQTVLFVIKIDIRNDMENHFKRKLDVWNGLLECNLASNLPLYIPISQGRSSSVRMMRYEGEVVFPIFAYWKIVGFGLWISSIMTLHLIRLITPPLLQPAQPTLPPNWPNYRSHSSPGSLADHPQTNYANHQITNGVINARHYRGCLW